MTALMIWLLSVVLVMQCIAFIWILFARKDRGWEKGIRSLETVLSSLELAMERMAREVHEEFARSRLEASEVARLDRDEVGKTLRAYGLSLQEFGGRQSESLRTGFETLGSALAKSFYENRTELAQQLNRLTTSNEERMQALRDTVEKKLESLQENNNQKLEQIRLTVDEKLHATLEQRLGDSFKLVSERLEQVHKGLGEMQTLAGGVGDLKRMMSNIKVRGTWGEVQLGSMLEQILNPDQYQANVAVNPQTNHRVEFAIKLPGKYGRDQPVWLPIDAKFPVEDYQRLVDAQDLADGPRIEEASKALERRVREEADSICEKYVIPPYTTDFALLFVPTEGLFAELIRRPGLVERLQRDSRVVLTGPTTLLAILNSLQMGFRTLAIEQRSSEVWTTLGAVKSEFAKFGDTLDKVKKKMEAASNEFAQVETRTRAINRKLRDVEELPAADLPVEGADDLIESAE